MFANMAGLAHALPFTGSAHPLNDGVSLVQEMTAAGRYHAVTAPISISATGSAIGRAPCHDNIKMPVKAITIDATAATKCDSMPPLLR